MSFFPGFDNFDEEGTPCPVRTIGGPGSSYFHDDKDDTANIDVTVALPDIEPFLSKDTRKKEKSKGLKEPPRRITNYVPPPRPVHEERKEKEREKEKRVSVEKEREKEKRVSTEDAAAVSLVPPQALGLQQQPSRAPLGGLGLGAMRPSRRRVSAMLKAKQQQQQQQQQQDEDRGRGLLLERTNQQRALNEKTANSPIVKLVQSQLLGEKKQLQAPPKRHLPTAVSKPPQRPVGAGVWRDRHSGKENMPPAFDRKRAADGSPPPRKSIRLSDDPVRVPVKKPAPAAASKPAPVPAPVVQKQINKPSERPRKRNSDHIEFDDNDYSFISNVSSYSDAPGSLRLKKRTKTSIGNLPSPPSLTNEEEAEFLPPEEHLVPGVTSYKPRAAPKRPLDPVLTEDIERVEMYEESWLSAQESSVAQLLNHLLAEYSPTPVGKNRLALRKEFLAMYSAAPFPITYNRVHASLLYGALSITQHVLDKSSVARISRPTNPNGEHIGWGADLGARQKFMDLFMGSYEQSALITALEVVVGREMFAYARPGEPERKVMESFIERYIINSEDLLSSNPEPAQKNKRGTKMGGHTGEDEDRGTPAWLLRRSLLRSFMLILLLDKAKSRGLLGRQCLFIETSAHKSSTSVLKALSRLLLPSIGDVAKTLSHLNYTLEAVQDPLSEFDYTISNLAVDMRDGVRLARVVEVLLHSKRRTSLAPGQNADDEDWPLSLHLQYPVTSRAQKLHNVSLVLSALNKADANPQCIEAKDIVDGYREKTVGLLWSVLSQRGLGLLLDWDTVVRETRRLEKRVFSGISDEDVHMDSARDHVELLKNWARCIGYKHGLTVTNLTTSFADGKVFEAIVKEYEQYLPSYAKDDKEASLATKLRGIGCNSYFAGLFDAQAHSGRVFKQDFVVAGLAYLCSRLVQPSIQERAAMTIQRAYRNMVFRANVQKRIRLLVVAHGCAEKVIVKNAAITIQRAFRKYVHERIQMLVRTTVSIQTFGRGVLARRALEDARWAATVIQRRWRAVREARFQERINVAQQATTEVQAFIRGILVRQRVRDLKRTVALLENRWQDIILGRQARQAFLLQREAAGLIQRNFRRYQATKHQRQSFLQARQSVSKLQALIRAQAVRMECLNRTADIIAIQFWYRRTAEMRKARSSYTALRNAALFVQRRRRETVLARSARAKFLRIQEVASMIKIRFLEKKMRFNAAVVLQRAWRARAWIVRMRRIMAEAVIIQSAWRGYVARKASGPRLRILRKRISKSIESGVKPEDTMGAKTKQAIGMVKTKAGFARGIAQLESKTKLLQECATLVAEDEAAITAILAFVDISVAQVQKSATSSTARTLTAAINTLFNVARVPACRAVIAARLVPKGGKDIFNVLQQVIETLKASSTNTPQYELLMTSMKTLVEVTRAEATRRMLVKRKKWVEKLLAALKDVGEKGKRRGAAVDKEKEEVLEGLKGWLVEKA